MYKLKETQKLAFAGILAAICVVIKFLKFPVAFLNVWVTFAYIPDFLAGIFLGPIYGLAVGFVGDIIGTLWQGSPISPLATVGNALLGGIMGMFFHYSYIKNIYFKIISGAFAVLVLVTYGINTIAQMLPPTKYYANFMTALIARYPQAIIVAVNTVLVIVLYKVLHKVVFKNYYVAK